MDQNLCYLIGDVTWFKDWQPKQWGGTLACRLKLPDIDIDGAGSLQNQSIFVNCSYKKEDMEKSYISKIRDIMENKESLSVNGGTIASREKDGNHEYFIKTHLYSISAPSEESGFTSAILHGQCMRHNEDWIQMRTYYRNPKATEKSYRYVNIYSPASKKLKLSNSWITVFGEIATKDIEGNESVHVVANRILV